MVKQISKKPGFRTPSDCQHVKGSQTLVKSAWQPFYHNSSSLWVKSTWKMSLLVICEILRVFANTMFADDKYPLENCENLLLLIQMELSKKRKTFSQSFFPFLVYTSYFKHFEKNDDRHI